MADSNNTTAQRSTTNKKSLWQCGFLLSVLIPVAAAAILYRLDSFDPSPLPLQYELTRSPPPPPPIHNGEMLRDSDLIGVGTLLAPEDLVYDPESRFVYTGCMDGWIKRVPVSESAELVDSAVENWVRVGGRPLGLALGRNGEVIVAHPDKGLLNISREGKVELLTDEADGVKFKLTDGVDVAEDGVIYFTDASHKYNVSEFVFDVLEGKPHGRLLSYDPFTKRASVLLRDLYFANGVAVSPDQNSVLFCETVMRRCRRYYVKGEKKGRVEGLLENMAAMPDNIKHDGEGHYWIALSTEITLVWDLACRYPSIRKGIAILEKYNKRPHVERNGGVLGVDLEGKPLAHFHDPKLYMISSALRIGSRLYCGSFIYPHLISFNLPRDPPARDS